MCRCKVSSAFIARIPFRQVFRYFFSQVSFLSMCLFSLVSWHHLLLYKFYSLYQVRLFRTVFSWYVASLVLVSGTSFWSCISLILFIYTFWSVFFCEHPRWNMLQFVAFQFTFVVDYIFFNATGYGLENVSLYFFLSSTMVQKYNILVFCLVYLNSNAIFICIGILTLSFQTGYLVLFLYTSFLRSSSSKLWNSGPIFIHIGFLILSFKTVEFWPYFCQHQNKYLILPNIAVFPFFL